MAGSDGIPETLTVDDTRSCMPVVAARSLRWPSEGRRFHFQSEAHEARSICMVSRLAGISPGALWQTSHAAKEAGGLYSCEDANALQ